MKRKLLENGDDEAKEPPAKRLMTSTDHEAKLKKERTKKTALATKLRALKPTLALKPKLCASLDPPPPVQGKRPNYITAYFMRHGQAEHNLYALNQPNFRCDCRDEEPKGLCAFLNPDLIDPELTELGRRQASAQSGYTQSEGFQKPERLYVSPLKRASNTALLAFPTFKDTVPWIVDSRLREPVGLHICDKHLQKSVLQKRFPSLDYSRIPQEDVDFDKYPDSREGREPVARRGHEFLCEVLKGAEKTVAVVSHSSFLLTLFNAVLHCDMSPTLYDWWAVGEIKKVYVWQDEGKMESQL